MEWLQFNDFHIGRNNAPSEVALKSLVEMAAKVTDGRSIDAVFLAGDLTYSGQLEEFAVFKEHFLTPLKALPALINSKFFAVPGNHDVNCEDSFPISWNTIGARNQPNYFGENAAGRKLRIHRQSAFQHYFEFINSNNLIGPNLDHDLSLFHKNSNLYFDILATNTAYFSDLEQKSSQPINPFPLLSLRQLVSSGEPQRPLLILGHHSPSSLIDADREHLLSFLSEKRAFYLHGHEHKTQALFDSSGCIRTLGFGASYVTPLDGQLDNGYRNSFYHCIVDDVLSIRFCISKCHRSR